MGETSARSSLPGITTSLTQSLRLLEGRVTTKELAERVVRAAMEQPGVIGARLWRVDDGLASVWAKAGAVPPPILGHAGNVAPTDSSKDPTIWSAPLGNDEYRMRILEVRGGGPVPTDLSAQLSLLARFAALALALAERRGAFEELSSIAEATKKLNSTLDLGELIHIILQIATRQSGAERGTVFLVDRERNEIWSLVGLGLEQQEIRLPADKGIAGWVARHGEPVRLENAYEDPRFEQEVDRKLGFKTKRLMCLPIRNEGGEVSGVLQLLNKPEAFTREDETFLDALSAHVALALEKAQLHRERVEKEKLERDLALAREIQAGLLPEAPPNFPGLAIAVSHRPSQMVGGDYYDFVPQRTDGKERLLVVVADVEGKGAASALVMANVQATLHAIADHPGPVETLPATINQKMMNGPAIAGGRRTKYLSMFVAAVEEGGRTMRYVNAGHVPPAVIRGDGRIEWLEAGGMIVGLLPEVTFESAEVRMTSGDLLVACTDGITEAMDASGNEFGRPRLAQLAAQLRNRKADEILRGILDEVEKHSRGGIYEDDRVLLILKAQ